MSLFQEEEIKTYKIYVNAENEDAAYRRQRKCCRRIGDHRIINSGI